MIIGLFLTVIVLYGLNIHKRELSIPYSALIWCGYIFLITELLSAVNEICTASILVFTLIYDLACVYIIIKNMRRIETKSFTKMFGRIFNLADNKRLLITLIILTCLILPFSQLMTIYQADSLNYHLPRIFMWYQNRSVAHFATSDTRLIGSPPLKEFVDLWIYALFGNIHEQMMNLTQWASYIVNILLVYVIAGKIGCVRKWRLLSAFVYAATPIAMVEAYTTQNDEFAAMFVLVFAVLILDFIYDQDSLLLNKNAVVRYIALVSSIGFIYLSKPSGMFAVLVFAIWLVASCLKRGDKVKTVVFWLFSVIFGSVLIILPEILRNVITYGQVTDPWQGPGQLALTIDPRLLLVNFVKNIGNNIIHMFWFWLSKVWVYLVYALANILHVNADNVLISEFGLGYGLRTIPVYAFDGAPNVILTILLLVLCIKGVVHLISRLKSKSNNKEIRFDYAAAAVISALLIFIFVKWEVAMARYVVAYLGLLAPVLGLKLQRLNECETTIRKEKLKKVLNFLVVFIGGVDICAVVLFQCFYVYKQMPLSDKGRGYYVFSSEASYENQYLQLLDNLEDYSSVGIVCSGEQWTYAALKVIEDHTDEVQFVMVTNDSVKYESDTFHPEAIIFLGSIPKNCQKEYQYNGYYYNAPNKLSEVCAVSECSSR